MRTTSARFPRQLDQNGLYHSVCMTCFRTIAITSSLLALTEIEWGHQCDGAPIQVSHTRGTQLSESERSLQAK
jgi:hypothetical protein